MIKYLTLCFIIPTIHFTFASKLKQTTNIMTLLDRYTASVLNNNNNNQNQQQNQNQAPRCCLWESTSQMNP